MITKYISKLYRYVPDLTTSTRTGNKIFGNLSKNSNQGKLISIVQYLFSLLFVSYVEDWYRTGGTYVDYGGKCIPYWHFKVVKL